MEAVGLGLLDGADIQTGFSEAGVASNVLHARIGLRTFNKVNTVRGSWTLLRNLARVPEVSQTRPKITALRSHSSSQREATSIMGLPASPATVGLAREDLQRIIRNVAADVLGYSEIVVDFPAGTPPYYSHTALLLCIRNPGT